MRGKAIGIFFAGFAAGVLFMAVILWRTGNLGAVKASAGPRPARTADADRAAQEGPAPAAQPQAPAAQPQAPAAPPPQPSQQTLVIPVQGVNPAGLRDNFNEDRGGHSHEALDIMAPRGTPVLAAAEGNVVKLFNSKQGGLTVYQFDDTRTYCFYYAHLDRYAAGLKEGALLRRGDVLGYVGTTGDAPPGSPHLHFAIFRLGPEKHWWQGAAIDPYPLLAGQSSLLR